MHKISRRQALLAAGAGALALAGCSGGPSAETPFLASGVILPVSDYTDLMPNFRDKVARWNLQRDIDSLRQSDGKYYLLPGLHQDVWVDYSLAVRTDILARLNLQIPATWDQ